MTYRKQDGPVHLNINSFKRTFQAGGRIRDSLKKRIIAEKKGETIIFDSATECADYMGNAWSTIIEYVKRGKKLRGWDIRYHKK